MARTKHSVTVIPVNPQPNPQPATAPRIGGASVWMRHEDWMELALLTFRASVMDADPVKRKEYRKLAERLTKVAAADIAKDAAP